MLQHFNVILRLSTWRSPIGDSRRARGCYEFLCPENNKCKCESILLLRKLDRVAPLRIDIPANYIIIQSPSNLLIHTPYSMVSREPTLNLLIFNYLPYMSKTFKPLLQFKKFYFLKKMCKFSFNFNLTFNV